MEQMGTVISSSSHRKLYSRSTPVKYDSEAGATGKSVAELPGRHISVAPWAAVAVWTLNVAGFLLGYQARKEYRARVKDQILQARADLERQSGPNQVMTRKEYKSFTRRSIMMLNSTGDVRPQRRFNSTDPRNKQAAMGAVVPKDLFNRPPRDSVIVAQVDPHAEFAMGEDSFYQFSQQVQQGNFWERASRASKSLSLFVKPTMTPRSHNRFNSNQETMMEMLTKQDQNNDHGFGLSEYSLAVSRSKYTFETPLMDQYDYQAAFYAPLNTSSSMSSPINPLTTPPTAKGKANSSNKMMYYHRQTSDLTLVGTPSESGERSFEKSKCFSRLSPIPVPLIDSIEKITSSRSSPENIEDLAQESSFSGSSKISPDEAVLQYALSRSNSVSSLHTLTGKRSTSALSFIRRYGQRSTPISEHHESFTAESNESASTVVPPMEITEPFTSAGHIRKRSPSNEHHPKSLPVHSIIFEEDESMLDQEEAFPHSRIDSATLPIRKSSLSRNKSSDGVMTTGLLKESSKLKKVASVLRRRTSDNSINIQNLTNDSSKAGRCLSGSTKETSHISKLNRLNSKDLKNMSKGEQNTGDLIKDGVECNKSGIEDYFSHFHKPLDGNTISDGGIFSNTNGSGSNNMITASYAREGDSYTQIRRRNPPPRILTQRANSVTNLRRNGSNTSVRAPLTGEANFTFPA
ncbi:hypothetical protein BY996DRAFT_6415734 [Phakopsora pachyrhizi]|nr:hypothetical protein BY996DRAFT_6415734 [Phakopsora pachyrhizi]